MQNFNEIARNFPEFTKGDIDVFSTSFVEFDKDGSGAIDAKELESALKTMGQGYSPQDVKELMELVDADKSGAIDFKEFLNMMRYFYPQKVSYYFRDFVEPSKAFPEFTKSDLDVFVEMFREFDEDESGAIDTRELGKLLKSMGQGCTPNHLTDIMKKYDADGSGDISWKELLEIMRGFYPEKQYVFAKTYLEPAINEFPEFSRSDVDAFVQSFREYDLDGNGSIDLYELGVAFKSMGQGCSEEALKKIVKEVDRDGNGTIEWIEFLAIMRKFYPNKRKEFEQKYYKPAEKFTEFSREDINVFITSFRSYDIDGNGSIDSRELGLAFKAMGQGCSPEKLKTVIAAVDENGNGTIEWPEFLTIMRNMYGDRPELKKSSEGVKSSPSFGLKSSTGAQASPSSPETRPKTTGAVGFGQHRGASSVPASDKCGSCGKTVYPKELISAVGLSWHKACFKCQESGCGISLTLTTFFGFEQKVYCKSHVPKPKASQLTTEGSLSMQSAMAAPKTKMASGIKKDNRTTFAPGAIKPINPDEEQ